LADNGSGSKRVYFSVPANDAIVHTWLECQEKQSVSLRLLVAYAVSQWGYTDFTCVAGSLMQGAASPPTRVPWFEGAMPTYPQEARPRAQASTPRRRTARKRRDDEVPASEERLVSEQPASVSEQTHESVSARIMEAPATSQEEPPAKGASVSSFADKDALNDMLMSLS
jgi:hypothetical protein